MVIHLNFAKVEKHRSNSVNQNWALRYGAGGNSGVLATALNVPHNVSNVYWLVRPIEHQLDGIGVSWLMRLKYAKMFLSKILLIKK